jgi:hypothetical protein
MDCNKTNVANTTSTGEDASKGLYLAEIDALVILLIQQMTYHNPADSSLWHSIVHPAVVRNDLAYLISGLLNYDGTELT